MRRYHVGDRVADRPQPRHRLLARFEIAAIAHGEHDDLLALPFGRKEGQRRRLAHHHPAGEFVRRIFERLPILLKHASGFGKGMDDEPGEHLGAEFVQAEFEGRHDPEIAAAAPDGPEKVAVFGGARPHQLAVRRDHIGRKQVVDRQSEFARDPAEPAAERQAGNTGRRVDAGRQCKTEGLRLHVQIGKRRSRLDPGRLRRRSTRTDFIGVRSITMPPSQTALPAML